MNKDSTQFKGNIGEMMACIELYKQGYTPYKPVVENCKYDLLAEKEGKVYKVEVKTTTQNNNGKFYVGLRGLRPNRTGNKTKVFDKFDLDLLAVVVLPENRVVIIDTKTINNTTQISV